MPSGSSGALSAQARASTASRTVSPARLMDLDCSGVTDGTRVHQWEGAQCQQPAPGLWRPLNDVPLQDQVQPGRQVPGRGWHEPPTTAQPCRSGPMWGGDNQLWTIVRKSPASPRPVHKAKAAKAKAEEAVEIAASAEAATPVETAPGGDPLPLRRLPPLRLRRLLLPAEAAPAKKPARRACKPKTAAAPQEGSRSRRRKRPLPRRRPKRLPPKRPRSNAGLNPDSGLNPRDFML